MDLSVMDSDMIYATVYQMMSDPEQYVGKTFRIEGKFYVTYDEMTKNQYYYCVIKDATECCAQGLEFVWGDGSHIYPDEYPTDGTEVVVDGTFELYMENDSRYCRLANEMCIRDSSMGGFAMITGSGLFAIGAGILGVLLCVYLCKWSCVLIAKLVRRITCLLYTSRCV